MATEKLDSDDLSSIFGIEIDGDANSIPILNSTEYFDHKCRKCGGSGRYAKRLPCFACKGTGKVPGDVVRTANFSDQYPTIASWIESNKATNGFAKSLAESIIIYGRLSPNQMAACEREIAKAAQSKAQSAIDIGRIELAFRTAFDNGIKRPKLRLDAFTFARAPDHGRNAGSIYVTEGEEYLGKVTAGKFCPVASCGASRTQVVIAVAGDPDTAAKAYGLRTGVCSCCGRGLTNKDSIDLGIGPICAEKFGW